MITTALGIDYGKKRVGIAVGNTLTRSAEPLAIITRESDTQIILHTKKLIQEWQVSALVIGIPRHPDDTPHDMTLACLAFAKLLRDAFSLPVFEIDERYTSAILPAKNKRFPNGKIRTVPQDDAAAAIILQQYLEQA